MKNLKSNERMLRILKGVIGGRVVIERDENYVTWYLTNKGDIDKIMEILNKYPLLSARKRCQLIFAKRFRGGNVMMNREDFLKLRGEMYKDKGEMLEWEEGRTISGLSYFPGWLSGFIEAEGHFKLVLKKNKKSINSSQFIIGQNEERHIMRGILRYLKREDIKIIEVKTREEGVIHYRINVGGKELRERLYRHFERYPLLGDKRDKFEAWKEAHLELGKYRK